LAQRQRWNPLPAVVNGVALGVMAGGLVIWATGGGDRWQDHTDIIVEITMMTTLGCVAVSYVRQFIPD
jgi:hypothetical protein